MWSLEFLVGLIEVGLSVRSLIEHFHFFRLLHANHEVADDPFCEVPFDLVLLHVDAVLLVLCLHSSDESLELHPAIASA